MNNDKDSRMLVYISLMALIFSCVVLGYSLIFFGFGSQDTSNGKSIPPSLIIIAGLVIATINGMASNILADEVGEKIKSFKPPLKYGIPLAVFLITLTLSIYIAIMSN